MNKLIKRITTENYISIDGISPVLSRVYQNRSICSLEQVDYSLKHLIPFEKLKGIDEAVKLLTDAIVQQQHIVIVGDFDVDGATSTTVALKALKSMGAELVDFLVPNRFEYGYGLTPEIVDVAVEQFKPDLIVTVDNGISSIAGVAHSKQCNIKVLVTDHHLPAEQLPDADAIVNPNQPGDVFPSKMLAGVGVIFYVMLALRVHLRNQNWFSKNNIQEPNLAELLDLVALGTVADVVPLDYNNRILVSQGLARIRSGHVSAGIQALIDISGREAARLVASDFGFAIAPRLNAAGRLEDMSLGIACLLESDPLVAARLAQQLDDMNKARREIEDDMKSQALQLLDQMSFNDRGESTLPFGLCLFDSNWHEGVVGILASRIKERWHRPVIVFAKTTDGQLKGSGRSIAGLHIRDALDSVAAKHPQLISKFGGHAMAAGLTIAEKDYPLFTRAFDEEVRLHLSQDDLQGVVQSDGELHANEFNLETAKELRYAGPWGQGFIDPVFDGIFKLIDRRIVAEKHLKMVVSPVDSDITVDAIAFNVTDEEWADTTQQVELAYRLDINHFRGEQNLQLLVEQVQPQ